VKGKPSQDNRAIQQSKTIIASAATADGILKILLMELLVLGTSNNFMTFQ
jgi:hypothetical protein